ncbi:hypothetical protein [Billgrantia endophytica]|uniref:Uncharacterized protein n=1 Tax=Billgrantia endophytica TaxID=2033802 RepID=A0A2N7U4K5_9GAMM|nr:hypothetical protein [Halomonas endophytica]PMR75366.1 hypothetical protein C1H69_10645 [Halomonas endophytica]
MFEWLSRYDAEITVLTNVGTLVIWLVYAQLLYFSFRRQRRPRLIINRGKKKDIHALCIISNMSAEPIFIQHIIAELKTSDGSIIMDVTDRQEAYDEDDAPSRSTPTLKDSTYQGPLNPGSFVHIDSFSDLIQRLACEKGIELEGIRPKGEATLHSLTVRLICIYGSEDHPVGAERCFDIHDQEGECGLVPSTWDTRRLASRWQRYKLRKYIRQLSANA